MLSNDQDLDLNERAQIFSGGFFIHEENVQNRVCPIDDQADQASIRDDVCRCHVLGGRGTWSPNVTDCLDQEKLLLGVYLEKDVVLGSCA